MIQLNIRSDIRQAERFLTNLRKNAVKKAAARAINDTLITLRAEGSREIKADHPALKISEIKKNMVMKKAHQYNLVGRLSTSGRPLSMLLFRPTRGSKRVGVKARIGHARGQLDYQGRKAFRIRAFADEVFVRRFGRGRQVRRLRGPSMPGVFRAQGVKFKRIAQNRWQVRFNHQLKYEIEIAKR